MRVAGVLEGLAAKVASGKDRDQVLSDGTERNRLSQTETVPSHLRVLLQKIHVTDVTLQRTLVFNPGNPSLTPVVRHLKIFGKGQMEVTYRLFGDEAGNGIAAGVHTCLGMHNVHVRSKAITVATGIPSAGSPSRTLVLQRDYAEALSASIANYGLPSADSLHKTQFARVSLPRVLSMDPSIVSLLHGLHLGLGDSGTEVAWIEEEGFETRPEDAAGGRLVPEAPVRGLRPTLTSQVLLASLEAWMVALVRLIFPKGRRFYMVEGDEFYGLEVTSPTWAYSKYGDELTFALYHPVSKLQPFLEVSQIETRRAPHGGPLENNTEVIYTRKVGPVESRHTGFSHLAMVPNVSALLDFVAESGRPKASHARRAGLHGGAASYNPETMMVSTEIARTFFAPTLLSAHLGQTARVGMPTLEHRISQCLFPGSHRQAYILVFCLEVMCQRWIAEGKGAVLGLIPMEILDVLVGWYFLAQRKFYQEAHLEAHARNFELS